MKQIVTNGTLENLVVKKKLFFTVVIFVMCMVAISVGSGFGMPINGTGTLNTTDSNRFVVFTDKTQFDNYVVAHEGDFFNVSTSERNRYNKKFFETNALVMFLTDGMSGSIKVSCDGYQLKEDGLHVTVKECSPQIHTMDLKYNTLCITIPQEIANCFSKVVIESYRVNI